MRYFMQLLKPLLAEHISEKVLLEKKILAEEK